MAVRCFSLYRKLDTKSINTKIQLGDLQNEFNKNHDKAFNYYIDALSIDPNFSLAHFKIATLYDEIFRDF